MTSVIVISYYSISYLLFSYLSITKKRREAEASPPSLYYELQILSKAISSQRMSTFL